MSIVKKIVEKYFHNKYDQKVIRDITFWLNNSEHEELKDEALRNIWDNLHAEPDESTLNSFRTFEQTNMVSSIAVETKRRRFSLRQRIIKVASILLLPILSATITYYLIKGNETVVDQSTEFVEYVVPNGEVRSIHLPDSSFIKLNAGSILILPKDFSSNERTVYLSGEAYFDVTHDKNRPFRVKTSDIDIEVLGTTFNVSSYQTNILSSASLKEGKLKVFVKDEGENYFLTSGEQVLYDRQTKNSELYSDTLDAFAWLDGNLCISKASIDELIPIIERKYGVNVYLSSSKFKNEKITMNLVNNENLVQCMDILSQVIRNLEYKIEDNNVFIY